MDARTASTIDLALRESLSDLDNLPPALLARAALAAADLVLLIDPDGCIADARTGGGDISEAEIAGWVGKPFVDTVTPEIRGKAALLLAGEQPDRWRHINHRIDGGDLPVRYRVLPIGHEGQLLAIGRDLRSAAALQQRLVRAQQAMERDSMRLRQIEARYRLLFDSALEPILVVDAGTRRIIEANPVARRITGLTQSAMEGEAFTALVHPDDREAVAATFGAILTAEQRHPCRLRLPGGDSWLMSATLFRQDRETRLLVRLRPLAVADEASPAERPLVDAMERIPDPFVLTDDGFDIIAGNGAFLDLVQQARREDLRGAPLSRFLGRPGIDLGVLVQMLRDHAMVRGFTTIIRAGDGHEEEVEVSAVTSSGGDSDSGGLRHGFSIRPLRRAGADGRDETPLPRSVEQLTELVGRVSLKDIVRESTDLIERLCIEAALNHTADNRASAAEILGLSRQSLYSKLHRHGLGNLGDSNDPD